MLTTSLVPTETEREIAEVTELETIRKVGGFADISRTNVPGTVPSHLVDSQTSIFQ